MRARRNLESVVLVSLAAILGSARCSETATRLPPSEGLTDVQAADTPPGVDDLGALSGDQSVGTTDGDAAALDADPVDVSLLEVNADVPARLPDSVEPDPDAEALDDLVDVAEPDAAPDDTADADTSSEPDSSDVPTITLPPASVAELVALLASGDSVGVSELVDTWDGPVCDPAGCLIVTDADSSSASVVALGGWNNWEDATALPLQKAPAAPETWWAVVAPAPTSPTAYKVKVDGEWRLDARNPHVLFGGFGFDSALVPPGFGRIRLVTGVESPQLDNTRSLFVYLPAAYFESPADRRFPVLYLNDGFNVFRNPKAPFGSWDVEVTADARFAAGDAEPVIMVGVDTSNRLAEYSYAPIDKGDGPVAPLGSDYADFLADTVRPLIDGQFRTVTDRARTGIAGSSLGGIISMYVGFTRPDAFGRVGSFSGAYWVGESAAGESIGPSMRELVDDNALGVAPEDLRVYIDSGDTSFAGEVAYPSDSWVYSDWTRNALIRLGWDNRPEWDTDAVLATAPTDLDSETLSSTVPHINWVEPPPNLAWLGLEGNLLAVVGQGHQHNEAAWRQRFGVALRFLYPPP